MKKVDIPKLGFRNIKTGIAVFICILLFNSIGDRDYFFACVATILCMGDTIEGSLDEGRNRLKGTVLGGLASISFLYIVDFIPNVSNNNPLIVAIGVSFVIYSCNLFKIPNACSVSCMVYIGIMLNYSGSGAFYYVLNRTLDTMVGVLIAIIINYNIKSPAKEDVDTNKADDIA